MVNSLTINIHSYINLKKIKLHIDKNLSLKYKGLLAILIGLFFILPSCKKYEDGPLISFRTKTNRLCRTWKLGDSSLSGSSLNFGALAYETEYVYKSDGTLIVTNTSLRNQPFVQIGTWMFTDNSKKLKTVLDGHSSEITIYKLTVEELWTGTDSQLGKITIKYVAKP